MTITSAPKVSPCTSCGVKPSVALEPDTAPLEDLGLAVQVGTRDWVLLILLVAGAVWLLMRGGK